jgi:hypothetical protein
MTTEVSDLTPAPDPMGAATARQNDEERRTREAKIAGAELLEAVLCCVEPLPEPVRLKREAVMRLVKGGWYG